MNLAQRTYPNQPVVVDLQIQAYLFHLKPCQVNRQNRLL